MNENSIEMQVMNHSEPVDDSQDIVIEEHKVEQITKDHTIAVLLDKDFAMDRILEVIDKCTSIEHAIELLALPLNPIQLEGTCSICQSALTSDTAVQIECGDIYCKPCLSEYIKIRIEESQVLTMPCPNHECRSQIPEQQLATLVSSELLEKYKKFKKIEELNKEPFLKFCPKPDCEGYAKGSLKESKLRCNVCEFEYCYYCSEAWHGNKKCKFADDKAMDRWANANGVKYCPNCKRKVEKLMGCDHMTCAKCNYEWCWLCGDKYSPGHFELCEVVKLSKKNPPLAFAFKLFFAPFLLPFACIVVFCVGVHKLETGSWGGYRIRNFVRKHLGISYFLAVLFGIALSPLFFVVGPLALSIALFVDIFKNKCCGRSCGKGFGVVVGVLLFPALIVFIVIGAVGAHFMAILIFIKKGYIAIRRCKDPGYMMPNSQYGYA